MVHFNKKFVECELLFDRVGLSQHHANRPSSFETMQKPVSSPILDRFSALLREREEESRDSEEEDGGGSVCMDEIVRIYEVVLSELTLNSKPLITELTIIAGEQRECAEGIADAICTRIIQVPADQKLPSLYLLDSIVKNIGSEYVRYFASRLPEVFVKAYRQVHPNQHPAMRHLFGTWSAVFPSSVLRKIGTELHFSSLVNERPSVSASLRSPESPCPTHGIHVNPKYLEARRQFEHATGMHATDHQRAAAHMTPFKGERMERSASASPDGWSGASPDFDEVHEARGISSNLHRHGQKPAVGHGEYDMDNAEIISQQVGIRRLGSPGIATRMSITGEQKFVPPNYSLLSSSSPSRVRRPESLSSSNDGYTMDNSPSRAAERASPLHGGFGYAADRLNKRGKEWEDSSTEHQVDNARPSVEINLKSEFDRQRPRALIDAYGNYGRESILNGNPLKIEPLVVSGINSDITTRRWQNTDEEEYLWEEMSPTLADRSRNNDLMPSNPTLQNTRLRSGFGRQNASITEPDYRTGYWPTQPRLPGLNDNPNFSEDASVLGSGLGDTGAKFMGGLGNQNNATMNQVSKYPREPWTLHHNFSQSSQLYPNVSGNAIQMSFPSTHTALSAGQRVSFPMDKAEGLSSMSSPVVANHFGQRPHSTHMASQRRSELDAFSLPLPSQRNQISGQFDVKDSNKPLVNHGANESSVLQQQQQQQQFDYFERKAGSSNKLFNQSTASTYPNNQTQGMVASVQPQVLNSLAHGSFVTPMSAQVPSPLFPQHFNRGHQIQGHGALTNTMPSNRLSSLPPIPMYGIPSTSFQVQVGTKPPLPPGPPPSSQMGPSSQILGPVASHTNLFGSLMAQGLISLTAPAPVQDSVGVEFDSDILKVRHESVIKALYTDLPRQCKTCGLRFKCQEEHSTHMDWHVTKNRVSRKSKQKPSQKWFVTTSLWLSGAENVGTDAVPGFLPNESIIEKNDDEVTAVPADENQSACALCGEPFEDFYSDETEEWMYKGAVYLKAPDGLTAGMDRSQLGSIVHAKCRSESTLVSNDVSGVYEGGTSEDGNQPKRMRVE